MRVLLFALIFFTAGFVALSPAFAAQETNFKITVKARDGMFIGTEAGGAQIMIRDRRTGDTIASGTVYGTQGDTDKVMGKDVARNADMTSADSAKYEFSLEFWEPTPVTITATAPYGQPQSMVSVSEDTILLPGKDYTAGNGIMIELPGFAVNISKPAVNQVIAHDPNTPIAIEANVMKLCGSKVEKDTPWAPEKYLVEAHVYKDDLFIATMEIPFSGEPGRYAANLKIPLPGTYRIAISAFDPVTKEAGMDVTTVIVRENTAGEKAGEAAPAATK